MTLESITPTPSQYDRLTKLEKLAVDDLVSDVVEIVSTVVPAVPDQEALESAVRDSLTCDGPMLPQLLGAMKLESVLTGDKDWGADDPPTDGRLGKAIGTYMGEVWPLVLSPSLTTDTFRQAVLD